MSHSQMPYPSLAETTAPTQLSALQACVSLAQEVTTHTQATQAFSYLRDRIAASDPDAATLLNLLWAELISARRSAAFWEQLCEVERGLTEQISADHMQLQQNYLRLVQEQ